MFKFSSDWHVKAVKVALAIGVSGAQVSFAQTPGDIEAARRQADSIQRLEQERFQRQQEESVGVRAPVGGIDTDQIKPSVATPKVGSGCHPIRRLVFTGVVNLGAVTTEALEDEFEGRCLTAADIEKVLAGVTRAYISAGMISARAYLPPQDLRSEDLQILVLEGKVGSVVIDDGDTESISKSNVLPGVEGEVLNLRDIEQGIDQINRLQSNKATLDIKPGKVPGVSDIVLHNKPTRPWHLNLSLDNEGARSVGEVQAGVNLTVDNPFGYNEMFLLSHRQSVPAQSGLKESYSDTVGMSIPFGYTTLSGGVSRSSYSSQVYLPSGLSLVAHGRTRTGYLKLDRVIYRDKSTRANINATLTSKRADNYFDNQFLGVSSRTLTIVDVDGSVRVRTGYGVFDFDVGYAKGLRAGGALRDPDGLPSWAARAQFGKIKLGARYAHGFKVFGQQVGVTSALTAQKADTPLYGSEQISIGSLYSVRGFTRNSLSGDHGYFMRNEFALINSLKVFGEPFKTRSYIGYDVGAVRSDAPTIPEGHLAGMALGVSLNSKKVGIHLYNTRPLHVPAGNIKEASQTWLRLSYSF